MPNCQCIPKECSPTMFYCILFGKWSIPGGLTSHLDTTMIPRFTACTRIIVSYRVDHGEHVCKLQLQQKNIHGLIRYQKVTDLKGPRSMFRKPCGQGNNFLLGRGMWWCTRPGPGSYNLCLVWLLVSSFHHSNRPELSVLVCHVSLFERICINFLKRSVKHFTLRWGQ